MLKINKFLMLSLCRENGMNARISLVLLPVSLREQGFGEAPLTNVWGREEEDRCSPRSARVICVNVPGHASSLYSLSHAARVRGEQPAGYRPPPRTHPPHRSPLKLSSQSHCNFYVGQMTPANHFSLIHLDQKPSTRTSTSSGSFNFVTRSIICQ